MYDNFNNHHNCFTPILLCSVYSGQFSVLHGFLYFLFLLRYLLFKSLLFPSFQVFIDLHLNHLPSTYEFIYLFTNHTGFAHLSRTFLHLSYTSCTDPINTFNIRQFSQNFVVFFPSLCILSHIHRTIHIFALRYLCSSSSFITHILVIHNLTFLTHHTKIFPFR